MPSVVVRSTLSNQWGETSRLTSAGHIQSHECIHRIVDWSVTRSGGKCYYITCVGPCRLPIVSRLVSGNRAVHGKWKGESLLCNIAHWTHVEYGTDVHGKRKGEILLCDIGHWTHVECATDNAFALHLFGQMFASQCHQLLCEVLSAINEAITVV